MNLADSDAFLHDGLGRSLLGLIPAAFGRSLALALLAAVLSSALALFLAALVTTRSRGAARSATQSILSLWVSIPDLLIALVLGAAFRPGRLTLFVALILSLLPNALKWLLLIEREAATRLSTLSAYAIGAKPSRVFRTEIFPELVRALGVKGPTLLLSALASETTLTFLGLGAPTGSGTYGELLTHARDRFLEAPENSLAILAPMIAFVTAMSLTYRRAAVTLKV